MIQVLKVLKGVEGQELGGSVTKPLLITEMAFLSHCVFLAFQTIGPLAEGLVEHSVLFYLSLLTQYSAEMDHLDYLCQSCNVVNPP